MRLAKTGTHHIVIARKHTMINSFKDEYLFSKQSQTQRQVQNFKLNSNLINSAVIPPRPPKGGDKASSKWFRFLGVIIEFQIKVYDQ